MPYLNEACSIDRRQEMHQRQGSAWWALHAELVMHNSATLAHKKACLFFFYFYAHTVHFIAYYLLFIPKKITYITFFFTNFELIDVCIYTATCHYNCLYILNVFDITVGLICVLFAADLNLLKTKRNLLYIRNQSVPRSKHFPPRL